MIRDVCNVCFRRCSLLAHVLCLFWGMVGMDGRMLHPKIRGNASPEDFRSMIVKAEVSPKLETARLPSGRPACGGLSRLAQGQRGSIKNVEPCHLAVSEDFLGGSRHTVATHPLQVPNPRYSDVAVWLISFNHSRVWVWVCGPKATTTS